MKCYILFFVSYNLLGGYMFKKIFTILGTMSLICFSFYYTETAIDIVRKSDPIMKEIILYSNNFSNSSSAVNSSNEILVLGKSSDVVDLDASYNNMKRFGKFDESLIVFKENKSSNTSDNNYKNYIISGNEFVNNVSLVFIIENTSYVEEIVSILNSKNVVATFFIDSSVFDNSIDLIKLLINSGHYVELFSDSYEISLLRKYNSIKKIISNENLSFCYFDIKNDYALKNCEKEKLYSIIPTINTNLFLYNDVKNNLSNGSIISIKNNSSTYRELPSVINYILQKGKKIVSLEKLIME